MKVCGGVFLIPKGGETDVRGLAFLFICSDFEGESLAFSRDETKRRKACIT